MGILEIGLGGGWGVGVPGGGGLGGSGGVSLCEEAVVAKERLRLVECSRSSNIMSPWVLTVIAER